MVAVYGREAPEMTAQMRLSALPKGLTRFSEGRGSGSSRPVAIGADGQRVELSAVLRRGAACAAGKSTAAHSSGIVRVRNVNPRERARGRRREKTAGTSWGVSRFLLPLGITATGWPVTSFFRIGEGTKDAYKGGAPTTERRAPTTVPTSSGPVILRTRLIMRTLGLVITAILIQVASAYSCTWRGVECIDYEVISNEAEYEERQYPETMWISVTSEAMTLFEAKRRSFRKLIYYIQGFNDQNVTVDLTTPHRTLVTRGASGHRLANYTMAFPLPAELYMNPPQANDKDIRITVEPPRPIRCEVSRQLNPCSQFHVVFGGKPNEQQWLTEAEEFIQAMRKDGRVNLDHFYVARYDLIFWVLERRNEIWLSMK
ncbi:hypothetical protein MRX96_013816 [Rhipicephalus microplus]